MKTCSKCKLEKERSEFYNCVSTKTGLSSYCKGCTAINIKERRGKDPEGTRRRDHKRYLSNKDAYLKRTFGISLKEWKGMHEAQGGVCDICKRPAGSLCVDHNHESGKVRGLLCFQCNTSLGGFQDSVSVVSSALDYLTKHS